MSELTSIPVIDLFAGPGGLAEGFSSMYKRDSRIFDIRLSIEKDENAHKTLELRSFYRQFEPKNLPEEYYNVLRQKDLKLRAELRKKLFQLYPEAGQKAMQEAWHAELGGDEFPESLVDERIERALEGEKKWILIGGPPCQAYSLAGRSRMGGISEDDHRVYLYKEYLRIIARHQPSVFVMENVKGLLSAKLNGESIFKMIKKDLEAPSCVFPEYGEGRGYRIYSLVSRDLFADSKYLIKSEKYGIPQKRHRVILIGVREDIGKTPDVLSEKDSVDLKSIIGDLPPIRSGLNKKYIGRRHESGKEKRTYQTVIDSTLDWKKIISEFRSEIAEMNGLLEEEELTLDDLDKGSEFMQYSMSSKHPLMGWYHDRRLKGIPNHESRSHLVQDLKRYLFATLYTDRYETFPRLEDYARYGKELLPDHENVSSGKFTDRFRVQLPDEPATTVTSHISKDGHYFIHYDPAQCRSLTVREAARIQTFPDNYLFCGSRTQQYHQVGNAVPPYLAWQISNVVWELIQ